MDFDELDVQEANNVIELRCGREQQRPPIPWSSGATHDKTGLLYGLELPRSMEMLQSWGHEWLTKAFLTARSIPATCVVQAMNYVTHVQSCPAENFTQLLVEVEFQGEFLSGTDELHSTLLVTLPSDVASDGKAVRTNIDGDDDEDDDEAIVGGATQDELRLCKPVLLQDRFREINFYRLCEADAPFDAPRYYFGDVSLRDNTFILITECVANSRRSGETTSKWLTSLRGTGIGRVRARYDYQQGGLDLDDCYTMVSACACFAGRSKAGRFGSPDVLTAAFEQEDPWARGEIDNSVGAFTDTTFLAVASDIQNFIMATSQTLFPENNLLGGAARAVVADVRATLLTFKTCEKQLSWWLGHGCLRSEHTERYAALGLACVDIDDAFSRRRTAGRTGFRRWHEVSMGSLGAKLWGCLKFAESEVIEERHVDELIEVFRSKYTSCGGPLLDSSLLRAQFVLASADELFRSLGKLSAVYHAWPRDTWARLASLQDARILERTKQNPCFWHVLRSFVNSILVIKNFKTTEVLHITIELIVSSANQLRTPLKYVKVGPEGGKLWDAPGKSSRLVCNLEPNWFLGVILPAGLHRHLRVQVPVSGWVLPSQVQDMSSDEEDEVVALYCNHGSALYAKMMLFGILEYTRHVYFGSGSVKISLLAVKLYDELMGHEVRMGSLSALELLPMRVVHGSFKVEERRKGWWPPTYEHWAHHSFVVLGDESIVDLAADQFDEQLPQCWWPADANRYSFESLQADLAYRIRFESVGIEKWKNLASRDASRRTEHEWWLLENKDVPLRASRNVNGHLLRNDEILQLPAISRTTYLGDGRPLATFRRLTNDDELDVFLVEDLFLPEELHCLISCSEARNGFRASVVSTESGKGVHDSQRTSSSCAMLWHMLSSTQLDEFRQHFGISPAQAEAEFRAVHAVIDSCVKALATEPSKVEPLQLVRYEPGQFFKPHFDAHKEPERATSYGGEQRTHTLLVFLCDVPESDGGGHLHFPALGLRVLPRFGSAVLWRNTQDTFEKAGRVDDTSIHEGEPTFECGKLAMNVWITDRPLLIHNVQGGSLNGAHGKRRTNASESQPATEQSQDGGDFRDQMPHQAATPWDQAHSYVGSTDAATKDDVEGHHVSLNDVFKYGLLQMLASMKDRLDVLSTGKLEYVEKAPLLGRRRV